MFNEVPLNNNGTKKPIPIKSTNEDIELKKTNLIKLKVPTSLISSFVKIILLRTLIMFSSKVFLDNFELENLPNNADKLSRKFLLEIIKAIQRHH